MRVLDHERLDVYKVARELSREVCQLRRRIRQGRPDLVDQLLRATGSIPLSIAEGTGERSPGRRAYFYRIAHGSATELAAAVDHMVDMDLLRTEDTLRAKEIVVRVVAMLVKLTRATQSAQGVTPRPRQPTRDNKPPPPRAHQPPPPHAHQPPPPRGRKLPP